MGNLGNYTNTTEILKKYGFTIQKRYGQNFLVDKNILGKIAMAADLGPEDVVLEIGPGIGALTQALCEQAGQVYAVEIDKKLIPILEETLREYDNVKVIQGDALKMDFCQMLGEDAARTIKVVANLPYYITSPILFALLESGLDIERITVMVQKEVADRMEARPGTKDYGALSLYVAWYATPKVQFTVSPSCFIPRPKVESAVINLVRKERQEVHVRDEKLLFSIIRAAFNQRRKTLKNSISNAGIPIEKEALGGIFEKMGLDQAVRGEALSLEEFAALSDFIHETVTIHGQH